MQVEAPVTPDSKVGLPSLGQGRRLMYWFIFINDESNPSADARGTLLQRKISPEVNILDDNLAKFFEIGKFRLNRQVSRFSAHFLLPAWAGQLAHFC